VATSNPDHPALATADLVHLRRIAKNAIVDD